MKYGKKAAVLLVVVTVAVTGFGFRGVALARR